jgi:hypothetical protein
MWWDVVVGLCGRLGSKLQKHLQAVSLSDTTKEVFICLLEKTKFHSGLPKDFNLLSVKSLAAKS